MLKKIFGFIICVCVAFSTVMLTSPTLARTPSDFTHMSAQEIKPYFDLIKNTVEIQQMAPEIIFIDY